MPAPHLHIIHPREDRLPGIGAWLASLITRMKSSADWDGCQVHPYTLDQQATINLPTVADQIERSLGPVLLIQKFQHKLGDQLTNRIGHRAVVQAVVVYDPDTLWNACEAVRKAYEAGEPLTSVRHVIAFLIVRKLERGKYWGGGSLNKSFLWADDLPKGGFPKDLATDREIIDVAAALVREGILTCKKSQGKSKYALGGKAVIEQIIASREFPSSKSLTKFFGRSPRLSSASLMDFNDG